MKLRWPVRALVRLKPGEHDEVEVLGGASKAPLTTLESLRKHVAMLLLCMQEESSRADQLLKFLETLSTHIQKRLLLRHLVAPLAKANCQQFLESFSGSFDAFSEQQDGG